MESQFHKINSCSSDFLAIKYSSIKKSKNRIDPICKYPNILNSLSNKTKIHCKKLIENSICSKLPFHNWQHTLNVVKNVMEIGSAEKIDNNSLELLVIAAYFHDVGHVSGSRNHEKMSCRYAMDFLKENGCQQDQLEIVQGIILATAMPQNPHTELQKIICDADLSHIGKASFWSQNEGLRLEWSVYDHNVFSDKQWVELNIKFFECHEFKTLYARDKFGKRKNRNLAQLKNQLKDLISID